MKVEKRDKRIVDFDDSKIEAAITKAFESINADTTPVRGLTKEVVQILSEQERDVIHIEEIQDIVEDTLMLRGFTEIARRYMKYREKHHEARKILQMMGVIDDLKFGPNAATVLSRYLLKDEDGNPLETPSQLFRRVSGAVASIEKKYDESVDVKEYDDLYYYMMANLEFLPNSPTLVNAGTEIGQCSACFVLPIEDNMDSIFGSLYHMALVQKSGGGTGFSFSRLRPEGSTVGTTGGVASGPISFMKVYDTATDIIKQGGCLSTDTLIPSTNGLMKLGSLVNGRLAEETPLDELVLTRNDYRHAFIAANNGIAEVIQIETELGYKLNATYNHRIRVLTKKGIAWKRTNELEVGDWIVIKRGGYHGKDSDLLSRPSQHHNATPIVLPTQMNPRLAEILGYFMGDGCLSLLNKKKARFVFSVSHGTPDVAEWIENYFEEIGLTPFREQKENDASWNVGVRSVTLAEWWIQSGFDKDGSGNANVPEVIFSSSRESICGFMRGLYEADGNISIDGYPRLFSISSELIEQVQQLLLSLGIVSRRSVNKNRATAYGSKPLHTLIITHRPSILLFSELIGFKSRSKIECFNERISRASGRASDPIPFAGDLITRYYSPPGRGCAKDRKPRTANPKVNKELTRYMRGVRNPHRERLLELSKTMPELREMLSDEVLRDDFAYSKISSLTKAEMFTGDIEVVGSEYVANGFLVHNRRRGANMAILRCDHPDIMEFISCKSDKQSFRNFNISVALTENFLKALRNEEEIDLVSPHSKEIVQSISARAIFDSIVHNAWSTGDPGLVFIDRINEEHPLKGELIEATNPCGEQPLLPYESCVLGSINLSKMVQDGEIDWPRLEEVIRLAVRFLDNIIDLNVYPVAEIEKISKTNRKIGLGIMGFAELLIKLGIPYDSVKGLEKAEEVMSFIRQKAERATSELAKIRGNFENFALLKKRNKWKRNASLITVAPTGSISLIAQTSSGIEPLFAISHSRRLAEGIQLSEVNPLFEKVALERGLWSDEIEYEVSKTGSVQHIDEVPADVKSVFKAAHEIDPEWHGRMQAAFQKHVDNAVSKTVNLPNNATTEDVEKIFLLADELKLKGTTVFRDGCLGGEQVLYAGCHECER
ncbi:MAG: adenosylcobalamin-dependent ribonucleoside-diphosphate reductase [Candidatus Thorarchaeota archaeon]